MVSPHSRRINRFIQSAGPVKYLRFSKNVKRDSTKQSVVAEQSLIQIVSRSCSLKELKSSPLLTRPYRFLASSWHALGDMSYMTYRVCASSFHIIFISSSNTKYQKSLICLRNERSS